MVGSAVNGSRTYIDIRSINELKGQFAGCLLPVVCCGMRLKKIKYNMYLSFNNIQHTTDNNHFAVSSIKFMQLLNQQQSSIGML